MIQQAMFAVDAEPPLETDHERGVYHWASTLADGTVVHHSSHPHPRLPFHCPVHRQYTSAPCLADHSPEAVAAMERMWSAPSKVPKRRKAS